MRASAVFGILLMMTYYFAHMDFPYIGDQNSFLVDYHLVYAGVLTYLIVKQAGHVWGLDGIAARMTFFKAHHAAGRAGLISASQSY